VLRIPRNAANGAAESELRRESRRWKILSSDAKYWHMVQQSREEEPVRQCYEWQVGQPKVESWVGRLQEELDTNKLGYVWLDAGGI
jgi:hypothetical protein